MNNDISQQDKPSQRAGLLRLALVVMIVIAALGYAVAFVQAERGSVHYNAYVEAYTTCYQRMAASGSAVADCNQVAEVREHLSAHRSAIAVGEPFFNVALALTAAVILLPLIRRYRHRLLSRRQQQQDDHDSTARHTA